MRVYLDSSAFVKQFSQEKGTETIKKIFEACEEGKIILVTSQWTIGECIAAIDRKRRRREITDEESEIIIATIFNKTFELGTEKKLIIIPVRQDFVTFSWGLIPELHVSADDAIQLLSAIVGMCDVFVAAEEFLVRVAKQEGLEAFNSEMEDECKLLLKRLGID